MKARFSNPQEAFDHALAIGALDTTIGSEFFVGDFMYMGNDISDTQYRFKHTILRYYHDVPKPEVKKGIFG